MQLSQVRPERRGRELVVQQQPKNQSNSARNHDTAPTPCVILKSRILHAGALAIGFGSLIGMLSGCGGVVFRNSGTTKTTITAALDQISCGTQSLTGAQSKVCFVELTAAASGPLNVKLTSSNAALQVPSQVTIATGAKSKDFNVVSSAVTKTANVTITGTAGGVTKTNVITLYPASADATVSLSKVSCGVQTVTGPTTTACSVYLSAATESPITVSLSSSSATLQVPASVTVSAGATTAGFNVTVSAVTTTQSATLTASANGVIQTNVLQLEGTGVSQPVASYRVDLSWNAPIPSGSIAGYRVYRANAGTGSFQMLNSALDPDTAFTDSTVQTGQSYEYEVTSVDSNGNESAPSNHAQITIP